MTFFIVNGVALLTFLLVAAESQFAELSVVAITLGSIAATLWCAGLAGMTLEPTSRVARLAALVGLVLGLSLAGWESRTSSFGTGVFIAALVWSVSLRVALAIFRWWWSLAGNSNALTALTTAGALITALPIAAVAARPEAVAETRRITTQRTVSALDDCLSQLSDSHLRREAKNVARGDEDIVSDVMLAVCERASRRPITELRSYFIKSVQNAVRNPGRWNTNRCSINDGDEFACPTEPEDERLADERVEVIRRLRCRLAPEDQLLLTLRYDHELSWRDVGRSMNIEANTAAQRHRRIISRLKIDAATTCNQLN